MKLSKFSFQTEAVWIMVFGFAPLFLTLLFFIFVMLMRWIGS